MDLVSVRDEEESSVLLICRSRLFILYRSSPPVSSCVVTLKCLCVVVGVGDTCSRAQSKEVDIHYK